MCDTGCFWGGITPQKSDQVGSWLACPWGTGIPPYCRKDETYNMCETGCFSGGITPETHFGNEALQIWCKFHFDLLQTLWTGCYKICDAVMACVKIRLRDWDKPQLFSIMFGNPRRMDGCTNTSHSYVPFRLPSRDNYNDFPASVTLVLASIQCQFSNSHEPDRIKNITTKTKHCTTQLCVPSNLYYKPHQIPKFKCTPSRLAVAFVWSSEARC